MENRVINERNQQGAMFFCYVKVSERLERTMDMK